MTEIYTATDIKAARETALASGKYLGFLDAGDFFEEAIQHIPYGVAVIFEKKFKREVALLRTEFERAQAVEDQREAYSKLATPVAAPLGAWEYSKEAALEALAIAFDSVVMFLTHPGRVMCESDEQQWSSAYDQVTLFGRTALTTLHGDLRQPEFDEAVRKIEQAFSCALNSMERINVQGMVVVQKRFLDAARHNCIYLGPNALKSLADLRAGTTGTPKTVPPVWLDIASAPKDGTVVDLWYVGRGRECNYWFETTGPCAGFWITENEDGCTSMFPNVEPTHWCLAPGTPVFA